LLNYIIIIEEFALTKKLYMHVETQRNTRHHDAPVKRKEFVNF